MPRGRGYDDDDLDDGYDDDADYGDDDGGGAGGGGGGGGAEEDSFPDGELLNATYDAVEAVVGATFGEAAIVAALRACNYEPERAIGHLLDPPAPRVAEVRGKAAKKAAARTAAARRLCCGTGRWI